MKPMVSVGEAHISSIVAAYEVGTLTSKVRPVAWLSASAVGSGMASVGAAVATAGASVAAGVHAPRAIAARTSRLTATKMYLLLMGLFPPLESRMAGDWNTVR